MGITPPGVMGVTQVVATVQHQAAEEGMETVAVMEAAAAMEHKPATLAEDQVDMGAIAMVNRVLFDSKRLQSA